MKSLQYFLRASTVAFVCATALTAGSELRTPPSVTGSDDPETRKLVREGLRILMQGDPAAAIEVFRRIESRDPQSPVGYLLEGDATWWEIYYTTGKLNDTDVFDVVSRESTPYDFHYDDLVTAALSRSSARLKLHEDEARNNLYKGLAYALQARLTGMRGKDLATARAGKKMRTFMLAALRLDSGLADANLGIGLYNYFVDTLPAIVKVLKIFIALPGGDRELGLQQLRQAAEQGELTRGEAKFMLAKDYSRPNEMQYARSLQLFQELGQEYPRNPLWDLLVSSVRCRMDQTRECEAGYREVLKKTASGKSEPLRAVRDAARQALQRMHPEEKLE